MRLSPADHARLKELADGASLSTYIRSCALQSSLKRRARSGLPIEDRQALAQILGLLGQSRIANNLNQLAYQANIGALAVDDLTRGQIDEAYEHVVFLRKTLLRALGLKG